MPREVEPQREAVAREDVARLDDGGDDVELLGPSHALQGKLSMVVYSENTDDLFDEGGDEVDEGVTLKVKSDKFK